MKYSLLSGAVFSLAGLLLSFFLLWNAEGQGWRWMIPASASSAFFVGSALWKWLVMGETSRTLVRGVGVGVLVGLLAHPVAWYLFSLGLYLTGARSSLGERTLGPIAGLWGALVLSLGSLLLTGWLTVPLGALIGGVLIKWCPR